VLLDAQIIEPKVQPVEDEEDEEEDEEDPLPVVDDPVVEDDPVVDDVEDFAVVDVFFEVVAACEEAEVAWLAWDEVTLLVVEEVVEEVEVFGLDVVAGVDGGGWGLGFEVECT